MRVAYDEISRRIGISGCQDDASPFTAASVAELMPAIEMDSVGKNLQENYQRKKSPLNRQGFFLGRPSLALLTRPKNNRKPYQYRDLDFYDDRDRSAYRPAFTLEELRASENFAYQGGVYVHHFKEEQNLIRVECRTLADNQPVTFTCRRLILAASCLSTARIVLRSFEAYDIRLPIISNPYSYLPAVQPYLLGRDTDAAKVGFAQLSLFYDPGRANMDVAMASIYSYRSLMAFRLLKETPLGIKTSHAFLQYMMPAFTILGLFHPERGGDTKFLSLQRDSAVRPGDVLQVNYKLSASEEERNAVTEKRFVRALRKLNCFVVSKIDPGAGSGIHYAGTLPFSESEQPFRTLKNGRLGGTRNVFVGDASGFAYLPGKGLTLSLMANAHNVALNALKF
jgi:hypothetical protein